MTAVRRDSMDSPFNAWIREQEQLDSVEHKLSVTDSDLWIHRYSERNEKRRSDATDIRQVLEHIMLVEVKAFCKKVPFAQRDTLHVIDAILRKATTINNRRRSVQIKDHRRPGLNRYVRWMGVHVLELENDRPDNSGLILWDNKVLSEQRLIEILRFDYDPDYPNRAMDTRRHHIINPAATMGGLPLEVSL